MEAPSTTRIAAGFIAAFVLLTVNAAVSYVTLDKLVAANRLVAQTEQTLKLLGELRAGLVDAEAGQRGYIITGEESYLESYLSARPVTAAKLQELARLTADDPEQSARVALLEPLIGKKFEDLSGAIAARRGQGMQAAAALVQGDQGKMLMDRIRRIVGEIQNKEEVLLALRTAESEFNAYITIVTYAVATFLNICLFGGICFMVIRGAVARRKLAVVERESNEKVARSLAEVQVRNQEITFLSQMSSFLQTCATSEEACTAIARFGPQLFPTEIGVIYLFHASRNYVEPAASWGGANPHEDMFQPSDCWALRRGRLHAVGEKDTAMVCEHVARNGGTLQPYICAPMTAQGETLGLLYLQSQPATGDAAPLSEARQQLGAAVAEQIALALANLRLRETLRQQSVRDPLTGLYNRRFLEETLGRELSRLERKNLPLSLIMIDVDHFKSFNDTFGHEAGDAVLRDLGGILQRYVRGSDIACRYGGEEFTIILPEADIDIGRQRAEMLREATRELRLIHDGKSLGAVTLSLGVACFPDHGRLREHLLQAADAALYEAKNAGRNCVVVSSIKTLKVVESPQQRDQAGR
ncbi:MAG: diguanylate cyclase [Betaproteobacteria bacterium]|nr:diguanylate cyclase [Betaproteobacteria bacterium]